MSEKFVYIFFNRKINQIKAFDIKNNEKAQEKFVNGYYSTCLANYVKKYAVYRDKLKGVDRTVRNFSFWEES